MAATLPIAAAVAGTAAAAAYLDAKYHITKDLADMREQRQIGKLYRQRAKENKRSLWYFFEEQAAKWKNNRCACVPLSESWSVEEDATCVTFDLPWDNNPCVCTARASY